MSSSMAYSSHFDQGILFAARNKMRFSAATISDMKKPTAKQTLIDNIQCLLRKEGWSNRELARRSGISDRMIGKILSGESVPTTETAESLAEAFGLEWWQLMLPGLRIDTISNKALTDIVSASMASKEACQVMESHAKYLKATAPANDKKNSRTDRQATG